MWWDDDGRWRMHEQSGAGWWFMVLLMLVIAIAVVVAVVVLLRGSALAPRPSAPASRAPDPRAILQERFARGEIDEQDYRARMRALDETGRAGG